MMANNNKMRQRANERAKEKKVAAQALISDFVFLSSTPIHHKKIDPINRQHFQLNKQHFFLLHFVFTLTLYICPPLYLPHSLTLLVAVCGALCVLQELFSLSFFPVFAVDFCASRKEFYTFTIFICIIFLFFIQIKSKSNLFASTNIFINRKMHESPYFQSITC